MFYLFFVFWNSFVWFLLCWHGCMLCGHCFLYCLWWICLSSCVTHIVLKVFSCADIDFDNTYTGAKRVVHKTCDVRRGISHKMWTISVGIVDSVFWGEISAFFGSYNVSTWHGNNLLRRCARCDLYQKYCGQKEI